MSQVDMLENQVLEEILRERASYYYSKKKTIDFWISVSPSFLEEQNLKSKIQKTNFYKKNKNLISSNFNKDFYSAIVSVDKEFITWLQLRLGYYENIDQINENKFVSDGISGYIDLNSNSSLLSPLRGKLNQINPEILIKKYKKILELYYSK
jgi:hypothetical protein